MPSLDIDPDDPTLAVVTPTVLSIPGSIMRRFESARRSAPSHTALALAALQAHAEQLPELVSKRRPKPPPGSLFSHRSQVNGGVSKDRPEPLRLRPTAGDLRVLATLAIWVHEVISHGNSHVKKVSWSEVAAAALDAYLPASRK